MQMVKDKVCIQWYRKKTQPSLFIFHHSAILILLGTGHEDTSMNYRTYIFSVPSFSMCCAAELQNRSICQLSQIYCLLDVLTHFSSLPVTYAITVQHGRTAYPSCEHTLHKTVLLTKLIKYFVK